MNSSSNESALPIPVCFGIYTGLRTVMDEKGSVDPLCTSNGESPNSEAIVTDGNRLAEDLLSKCQNLLRELEEFRNFITEQKLVQDPAVEIRKFQTSVATELKILQKVYRPRLPSWNPAIDYLPAQRVRSYCRKNSSYASLVQSTVLFSHMGICKSKRKPGNIP